MAWVPETEHLQINQGLLADAGDGSDMQAVVGFAEKHDAGRIGKLISDFPEER